MKYLQLLILITISLKSYSQCWQKIAVGTSSYAIKNDGTLWAWGENQFGQLGNGTVNISNLPVQVGTDSNWAEIDANGNVVLALKTDGSIWTWGKNVNVLALDSFYTTPIQIGSDNDWIKIAAPSFAIKSNGTLWAWGLNNDGDLGLGNTEAQFVPTQVGAEDDWIEISAGSRARLSIKSDHSVWGWYYNYLGALAIGPINNGDSNQIITIPTQTGNNTSDWNSAITNGCCFTKMIKQDGSLWACGSGFFGNIGDGTETAEVNVLTHVGFDNDWVAVDTSYHTLAIKNNGTLWGWGANQVGQIGDGTTQNKNVPTPTGNGISWMSIALGLNYSLALSNSGTLYAWGLNNNGQLGDGTFVNKSIPTQIGTACVLSTTEHQKLDHITVYPNPTKNKVVVSFLMPENEKVKISIYNMMGQIVFSKEIQSKIGSNEELLDLTNYGDAIYSIVLESKNLSGNVRIMKVK